MVHGHGDLGVEEEEYDSEAVVAESSWDGHSSASPAVTRGGREVE